MLGDDFNAVIRVAHEAQTAGDVDRFLLALADEFQMLIKRVTTNPVALVQDWVAFGPGTR
jgi:hypothetical protein